MWRLTHRTIVRQSDWDLEVAIAIDRGFLYLVAESVDPSEMEPSGIRSCYRRSGESDLLSPGNSRPDRGKRVCGSNKRHTR
jgi:hypothetical protein